MWICYVKRVRYYTYEMVKKWHSIKSERQYTYNIRPFGFPCFEDHTIRFDFKCPKHLLNSLILHLLDDYLKKKNKLFKLFQSLFLQTFRYKRYFVKSFVNRSLNILFIDFRAEVFFIKNYSKQILLLLFIGNDFEFRYNSYPGIVS